MADTATEATTPVAFDTKAHIAARNAADEARRTGKEPAKPAAPAAVETKPAKPAETKQAENDTAQQPHLPRAARREMNRLREDAAHSRGMLEAYEKMGLKPDGTAAAATKSTEDPEPKRAQFGSDADYHRALGRWDARQEAAKLDATRSTKDAQAQELEQLREEIATASDAAQAEIPDLFPDWDAVAKAAAEDPDAPEFVPAEHAQLMLMLAKSDMQARIQYHWAKNSDDLEAILALTKEPAKQVAAFHRLEGRVEKLYTAKQKETAAEAGKETTKDRATGEKAAQASGTSERDARKPRPSAEVAAKGGSAPPDEPAIGSKAWMEKRNQAQHARHY